MERDERESRSAAALRANLHRRKAQERARQTGVPPDPAENPLPRHDPATDQPEVEGPAPAVLTDPAALR